MKLTCEKHKNFIEALLPNSSYKDCFSTHGIDEFTLSHFLSGCIGRELFKKQSILVPFVLHLLWEYLETTKSMKDYMSENDLINGASFHYGGDTVMNCAVDNIAFLLGYYVQTIVKGHLLVMFALFWITWIWVIKSSNKRFALQKYK